MAKKWFAGVSTITELKLRYRELARQYHPDVTQADTNAEMAEINSEYEHLFQILPKTESEQKANASAFDGYREAVNAIINLDDITIELVGTWIWVSGNTYKHKETLKDNGYKWAPKKKMWYWREEKNRKWYPSKPMEMDSIREKYGSQIIANNPARQWQAIPASN